MSLRTRLVVALAGLALLATAVVAVTGYATTRRALRSEIDRTLTAYARQLRDPGGRTLAVLCGGGRLPGGYVPGRGLGEEDDEIAAIPDLPGSRVQCLSGSGRLVTAGDEQLPVDQRARRLARSGGRARYALIATVRADGGTYRVLTVPVPGGGAVQLARNLGEADLTLETLRNRYLLVGLFALVAATAAGWLIARRITAPLAQLTDAAEQVAATGEPRADLAPGGDDEVGRLSTSFATMLDALMRSRRDQQRLAQDAGHELRTPLTSLRANIDTLRRHPDLDADRRGRVLDDLDAEARELSLLTDELIDLVAERRSDDPAHEIDLAALVRRAVDRMARRSDHEFSLVAEPGAVVGQSAALLRAITNLLDNAAKFSPPGSPIEVRVANGAVTVRDHGPGIAAADLPHVFDRFYRSDGARALPGSGLGLAIVARVAADHGGRVGAANAADGGAVLTLELPPAPAI
ncbi:MAG: sensor histidine kinase [Actinomycetota bacterium]